MFSWQEQYLTRSLRSLVRYCSCHSDIKFISSLIPDTLLTIKLDQWPSNSGRKRGRRRRPESSISCKIDHVTNCASLYCSFLLNEQISGEKTLGENIADLGGVNLAYHVRTIPYFVPHLINQTQMFNPEACAVIPAS